MTDHRHRTIAELASQLRRLERIQRGLQSSPEPEVVGTAHPTISTGIPPLDRLLPDGGLHPGMLVEWMAVETAGGTGTLAWKVAAALLQQSEEDARACIAIDMRRSLYPPAVAKMGIDLSRLLVVRPRRASEVLWVMEQSLRCPGVLVVIGHLAEVRSQEFRRLQLAAEAGGTIGLLLRTARERSQTSWADMRLLIKSEIRNSKFEKKGFGFRISDFGFFRSRLLSVELLHCRGRLSGGAVTLEIDDVTGTVRVASRLAAAARPRRAAGA